MDLPISVTLTKHSDGWRWSVANLGEGHKEILMRGREDKSLIVMCYVNHGSYSIFPLDWNKTYALNEALETLVPLLKGWDYELAMCKHFPEVHIFGREVYS